ncbi:MAG: M48 family metalloprotease [Proteobacteria bacterium]|nr:M48 family metalloprotease [Pseudomonadota bacterium]
MSERTARRVLSLTSCACLAAFATGCALLAFTSNEREAELGAKLAAEVEAALGTVSDAELAAYVDALGQRLAATDGDPEFEYHFYVVEMVEPNAFALPGGHVFVSRGLLALLNTEDELANVLGHEIGHIRGRHAAHRTVAAAPLSVATGLGSLAASIVSPRVGRAVAGVGGFANQAIVSPYSREQERDADRRGQELAARAGYDPGALSAFLRTLEREAQRRGQGSGRVAFLATHPSTAERAAATAKRARQLEPEPAPVLSPTREAFLSRLVGLQVGPSPAAGVFRDELFLHPDLNFALRFPAGWETANRRDAVAAKAADADVWAMLQLVGEGDDPSQGLVELARESRVDVGRAQQVSIHGKRAVRLDTRSQGRRMELTWIAHENRIYRIVGAAPVRDWEAASAALRAVSESFRSLSLVEAASIEDQRLQLVSAREGETIADVLGRAESAWSPEEAAVANGVEMGTDLGGRLVKVTRQERYRSH